MEFYIQKSKLQEEMGRMVNVVDKKSTIPILENTLIKSDGMNIKFTATDLDLSLFSECTTDQISGGGEICVPSRRLFDIVKLMADGIIKISGDPTQWLKVQSRGSNYKIASANPGNYPETPKIPTDWVNVPGKIFRLMLKGVAFATAANDDNRYAIAGVKLQVQETDIKMLATDGHRISMCTSPLDDLMFTTVDTILPGKAVGELTRLLSDYDGLVGISVQENGVFFKMGSRVLHSRLLAGKFPSFGPAFDTIYPIKCQFKADILSQSLRRTMQVSEDKLAGVTFNFTPGKLVLYSQAADIGECDETLMLASNLQQGELSVTCSARYLLDFIEQMGNDELEFELRDSKTPLHLRLRKDGVDYRYILIPMRDKQKPQ